MAKLTKAQEKEKRTQKARKIPKTYKVKEGDSWFKIAGQMYQDVYGTNTAAQRMAEELRRSNPNISGLQPGQRIRIPRPKRSPYMSTTFGKKP